MSTCDVILSYSHPQTQNYVSIATLKKLKYFGINRQNHTIISNSRYPNALLTDII